MAKFWKYIRAVSAGSAPSQTSRFGEVRGGGNCRHSDLQYSSFIFMYLYSDIVQFLKLIEPFCMYI